MSQQLGMSARVLQLFSCSFVCSHSGQWGWCWGSFPQASFPRYQLAKSGADLTSCLIVYDVALL